MDGSYTSLGGLDMDIAVSSSPLPSINDLMKIELEPDNKKLGLSSKKLKTKEVAALWKQEDELSSFEIGLAESPRYSKGSGGGEDDEESGAQEVFHVLCAGCGAVNHTRGAGGARFVCGKCSQGCKVPDGVFTTAKQSEEQPIMSEVGESQPCPDTGEEMSFEDWRARVLRFYAVHAPERVPGRQLDQILRSWAGREDELWRNMRRRYGEEPSVEVGERSLQAVLATQLPPIEDGEVREDPATLPKGLGTEEVEVDMSTGDVLGCEVRELPKDRCLVVSGVTPGTPASRSLLRPAHRLHSCNGVPVDSIASLASVLKTRPQRLTFAVSLFPDYLRCPACSDAPPSAFIPESAFRFACTRCGTGGLEMPKGREEEGGGGGIDWTGKMLRFYAKYAPERVAGRQVNQILRSWAGREDELWGLMLKRYGPEPTLEEGSRLLAETLAKAAPPEDPPEEDCNPPPSRQRASDSRLSRLRKKGLSLKESAGSRIQNLSFSKEAKDGEKPSFLKRVLARKKERKGGGRRGQEAEDDADSATACSQSPEPPEEAAVYSSASPMPPSPSQPASTSPSPPVPRGSHVECES